MCIYLGSSFFFFFFLWSVFSVCQKFKQGHETSSEHWNNY